MMVGKIVERGEDGRMREHFQSFLAIPAKTKKARDGEAAPRFVRKER
jgi:hypothetical protein